MYFPSFFAVGEGYIDKVEFGGWGLMRYWK